MYIERIRIVLNTVGVLRRNGYKGARETFWDNENVLCLGLGGHNIIYVTQSYLCKVLFEKTYWLLG